MRLWIVRRVPIQRVSILIVRSGDRVGETFGTRGSLKIRPNPCNLNILQIFLR